MAVARGLQGGNMPTASNMPMPMNALDAFSKGFGLTDNLMKNLLAKKQLAQQMQIHKDALGIQQQQQARLAQLAPLQRMLMEAQTGQAQAKAKEAEMLTSLLGGHQPASQQAGAVPVDDGQYSALGDFIQGQGALMPQEQQPTQPYAALANVMQNRQFPDQSSSRSGETILNPGDPNKYGLDEYMRFKQPGAIKQHYENGQLITTYPESGKVTMQQIGASPEEIGRSKEIGKYRGKAYGDTMDALSSAGDMDSNLQFLKDIVDKNPNFNSTVGPVSSFFKTYAGTPEEQDVIGKIATGTGNILLDAAKNIKGAFTGRDQTMINAMKPNLKDMPEVFKGKLNAYIQLNQLLQNRLSLYADLLHDGVPPHKALTEARKHTDLAPVYEEAQKSMGAPSASASKWAQYEVHE